MSRLTVLGVGVRVASVSVSHYATHPPFDRLLQRSNLPIGLEGERAPGQLHVVYIKHDGERARRTDHSSAASEATLITAALARRILTPNALRRQFGI